MSPIKFLVRMCRSRVWGTAAFTAAAVMLTATSAPVMAKSHPVQCPTRQGIKLTAAQKRACQAKRVTAIAAKKTITHTRIKHGKLAQGHEDAPEVRRIAVKRVIYSHGHKRVLTSYRTVNFTPRHSALDRGYGLHSMPYTLRLGSNFAYVVDQSNSEVLYDKNSREVTPIASISKLMTAMVSLDANIPLDQMMEVTDADRDYEKGTGSRLSVGSRLSREDMLHIALMASENRAAAALSRYYPGGRPAFIAAMNKKAQELGMTDTHFDDPTGLSFHNVSSARDLVKMIEAAEKYPLIRRFSTGTEYDVNTGKRELHYVSTNHLVGHAGWDINLQKTGFINEAGQCLVMQANVHGRQVIIVLLDSSGKYTRFADAIRVRNWLLAGGGSQQHTPPTAQAASEQHAAL